MRAQLLTSAVYVVGGIAGAAAAGALGSRWGVAIATLLGAGVWWWQLHAGLREHPRADPAAPVVAPGAPHDHGDTSAAHPPRNEDPLTG